MLRAEKNRDGDLVGFGNFTDGDQWHPANITLRANIVKMMKQNETHLQRSCVKFCNLLLILNCY